MKVKISRRAAVMVIGGGVIWLVSMLSGGEGAPDPWGGITAAGVVFFAALIHELGHVTAAWGAGVPIQALRLDLFGARMELSGMLSYGQELLVAAGGPFFSLLSAALTLPFCLHLGGEGSIGLFFAASLCLGGLNLLPVQSMDGGRMLGSALSLLFGAKAGDTALRLTTGLCLGGLWLLSVYTLLRVGQMLTLFVFSLCLLLRLLGDGQK